MHSRYQTAMEDMMFELLAEQRFSMRNLEVMMKSRFPGCYSLASDSTDPQDIGNIRMLFDNQYEKTEWMMKWA